MAGRRRRRGTSVTASGLLVMAVVAAVTAVTSAQQQQQQQPPGQQQVNTPSCPPAQASLSPCVSYFIGNSSSPSDACCDQMRAMFQSQAPCLCAAVASAPSPLAPVLGGVQSLLPTACNLPPNACTSKLSCQYDRDDGLCSGRRRHNAAAVLGDNCLRSRSRDGTRWDRPGDALRWWIQVSADDPGLGCRWRPWRRHLRCRRPDIVHARLCLFDLRCSHVLASLL
ncbi:hypothetical protein GUJ93_ZPchr0003g17146 [Zizania palustris]|uniref:Bifunctional inhibitor/plant lipid transfer protein/seed storage helical domain-containing protein n=1 Tax=Zizania palustris TaxID=103762 RepID=A0A8J5SUU7_ZIZPA|nr:hypothetical protein GUJ93_ZPchr0003g17146 [Zizania palustris]